MLRSAVTASIIAAALAMPIVENAPHDRDYYVSKFVDWMTEHSVAPRDGAHFVSMLQNYINNDNIIEETNAQGLSYTLGHNRFSHMSLDEFREFVQSGGSRPTESEPAEFVHHEPSDVSTLAATVDWKTSGAVTAVKDQGQCGSCWSFSTTGAIEGARKIKYGSLISYSEQNFVDCDNLDSACNGGWMSNAFTWAKKNGGVCTESAYPYTSGTTKKAGTCNQSKCTKDSTSAPASYTNVASNSVSALKSALNKQPVAVAIEADQSGFQLYKSGVYAGACGTKLDHGVLATGYGTLNGAEYWDVKNSWGAAWGDQGYIKLAINVSQKQGQCGILSGPPVYPNV